VRFQIALRPAAAVQEDHGRQARRGVGAGGAIGARPDGAGWRGNVEIANCSHAGCIDVSDAHHRVEPRACLRHRDLIDRLARHGVGRVEDGLRIGIECGLEVHTQNRRR